MYFAVIDCGIINSRIYIVNGKKEIVGKASKKVGVRDTTIQGSNTVLKSGFLTSLMTTASLEVLFKGTKISEPIANLSLEL